MLIWVMGDKATTMYGKIPEFVARKFGGRVLGVETYVLRKVKTFQNDKCERTLLPVLELIGLWNVSFKLLSDRRDINSCQKTNW